MAGDFRPLRLVWALGLLVLIASMIGTAWYLGPWSATPHANVGPDETDAEDVVAQGHVDVRSGVVALYPSQPGRVVKVMVTEGQSVDKAGAPLICLDDRLARMKRDEAEAAWKAAKTQRSMADKLSEQHEVKIRQMDAAIKIAEQNQSSAEADYRRQKKLHVSKSIPEEALTIAEAQVERAKAMVDAEKAKLDELKAHSKDSDLGMHRADAEVLAAKARLDQAQLAVDECTIRSPSAGKVLRLQASVGDMLSPQPLQPALTFCPDEPLVVRAEVHQENVGRIHVGDKALVVDEMGSDQHEWQGEVSHISDWLARRRSVLLEPGQLNDVRTLECIIKLNSTDPGLRIGQRVRVHIKPHKAKQ